MAPQPLQAHRTPWRKLSAVAAFRRACAVVDESGVLPAVESLVHAQTGRRRQFTARALLVGLILHSIRGAKTMVLTEVVETLSDLTPSQRQQLGLVSDLNITYAMVWHGFDKLASALDQSSTVGTVLTTEEMADRLLIGSIPPNYEVSESLAIDGTDVEAWARRRSWGNKKSLSTAGTEIPADTVIAPSSPISECGWPKTGADGRPQHSPDPDARDGYRSGHNGHRGDIYVGYELHAVTQVPKTGQNAVPHLVVGMTLTPGGKHRGHAAVRTIDAIRKAGRPVLELLADRGYTYCLPTTFVLPMWARGIDIWADLHPNQVGIHPGPITGTVWIDGSVYTDRIPEPLRHTTLLGKTPTAEEKIAAQKRFDLRMPYQYTPLTARDTDGYQRLKGPARAGLVRCPNMPRSMRLSHTRPTTNCVAGQPCGCGSTVTIGPDNFPRERQKAAWGTTDWARNYYRRSAIESTNAELKVHRLSLHRGAIRTFGLTRHTLLLGLAIAGMNVRLLREWHARRRLPDPWALHLNEDDTGCGPSITTKTRARRRTAALQDLLGQPPPGSNAPELHDNETAIATD